jgi:hypothetical protein
VTDHLTSRAQRLIDEFEGAANMRYGLAKVLMHVASAWSDSESWYAVPSSTLMQLAAELTAPSLLDRAMTGDVVAARQFLYEAGFTDKGGQLLPHYQSISQEGYDG